MADNLVECSFLIPLHRDANLSDGGKHRSAAWRWLDDQLFEAFGGGTTAPGKYQGSYTDPDTGERVRDQSNKFLVAIDLAEADRLRAILAAACEEFRQKCIYLCIAGIVEFVRPTNG